MIRNIKVLFGVILLALVLIAIIFFHLKPVDNLSLTDMWRDNGSWFSNDTGTCFAFINSEIRIRPRGPFSRLEHHPVLIANNTFSYPQTNQAQRYQRDTIANRDTLFIDGDGPIQPGTYQYGGWSHCNLTMLS
jgi:hypothetical protein